MFALEGEVKGNSGLNKIKSSIDFQLLTTRQGHPTSVFREISVRKTISDLEFSEHLL